MCVPKLLEFQASLFQSVVEVKLLKEIMMSSKRRVSDMENGLNKKENSSLSKFVQLLLKIHFIPVRVFTKEGRASFRLFSSTSLIHIVIYFGLLGKH